jgi:molybdopterin-guanine dinucleotide biosynthesis protein A
MSSASAVILAGGQSRRMGRAKAALPFGKRTILERLIAELGKNFDDLLIIAAPKQTETFAVEDLIRTASAPVRLLRDRTPYQGAASALACGLTAASNEVAFACSCDLPLLRAEVALALCTMLSDYQAVIPGVGGKPQPLCAVYRRQVADVIEMKLASGERRLTQLTQELNARRPREGELRRVDPELYSFVNVNTPQDYNRVLTLKHSLQLK